MRYGLADEVGTGDRFTGKRRIMGTFYHITCRNRDCRYSTVVREGPGMILFAWIKTMEADIKGGKRAAPADIKALLDAGHELECVATYLCPACKEWKTEDYPYVLEKTQVSPYGTIREYKVHYLREHPRCKTCGTDLEFILNPRSSKNCCPLCGTSDMKVGSWGCYD